MICCTKHTEHPSGNKLHEHLCHHVCETAGGPFYTKAYLASFTFIEKEEYVDAIPCTCLNVQAQTLGLAITSRHTRHVKGLCE